MRLILDDPVLLCSAESRPQFFRNIARDLGLQSGKITCLSAVLFAPDLVARVAIDKIEAYGQIVAPLRNTAVQYRLHL